MKGVEKKKNIVVICLSYLWSGGSGREEWIKIPSMRRFGVSFLNSPVRRKVLFEYRGGGVFILGRYTCVCRRGDRFRNSI